ncbi:MAG: hypothetical protein J0L53_04635 [Spirochaetes bacterium]|nr:hypothetical protein [Spirochaetota bacterium]
MEMLTTYWWVIPIIVSLVAYKLILKFFGIVVVPNDAVGIVNKRFSLFGAHRTLPDGAIIALKGEAGLQADTLAPGLHYWLWPWQYDISLEDFVTIPEGKIGVVEAKDGVPLGSGRVLAKYVDSDSFQDARKFIEQGGERGPQMTIIPPGTYRINTALFTVSEEPVLEIPDNRVGIVTVKEGRPLEKGEIAGKEIPGHNLYQNAQEFLNNGGFKGLQEQVILAGRYFINPRFATVEIREMTTVPIANVGVVISYVGKTGVDVTGDSFRHGNLVKQGEKGVWVDPLDPGKYPINPYTHKVEIVPTANVVLNWATGKSEAHKLDEKLSTIKVRSSDGFTFNLDVSQIIHIPRTDAPKVIARFGSVANLVTQVLEPTIGNYFRNAAQGSDVIGFLKSRKERQDDAKEAISKALGEYNVGAVDTLIGDIVPPDDLMKTLTDRKIAEQEKITYDTQREAENVRKDLQQAKALADTQARVVDAERKVQINEFEARAAVKKAEGEAQSKTLNAEADAMVLEKVGAAEGTKIKSVGTAEADVIQLKIKSMDSGNYAAIEVAKALAASGFKLVPDIIAGGESGGQGSLVNTLMAMVIRDQISKGEKSGVVTATVS